MKGILNAIAISGLIVLASGCGKFDHSDKRTKNQNQDQIDDTFNPADPYIVRGQWEIPLTSGAQNLRFMRSLLGTASSSAPIWATVAAAVKFTVDTANFVTPANPVDVA